MPRIVPSQVVQFIDNVEVFEKAAMQMGGRAASWQIRIDLGSVHNIRALIRLVEELPNDLLTIPAEDMSLW